MNVHSRIFGSIPTAAALLSAPAVQAGPQPDPLLSGFVVGVAVDTRATTAPEPPPSYASPGGAWHAQPDHGDHDADVSDE
ncbi:hypothetical protein J2S76_004120 [Ancylobacter vacuolatus]|uniref:Uncharacterized protein n=1 Tax=Ancylobacter vacuolatus TaxID=223389 RepID=A0ABU0DMK1_9HYPH|nr:hypothetical protein [Ancylobacter vacuolatus]